MADKKISQLTGATTPLAGTEVLPVVQGSATVKVAVSNLTAGRSVQTADLEATSSSAGVTKGDLFVDTTNKTVYVGRQSSTGGDASSFIVRGRQGTAAFQVDPGNPSISANADLTFTSSNLVQGTAAKGVTTGGAFSLGLGTNGSTTQASLTSGSNLTLGAASLPYLYTDTSNAKGVANLNAGVGKCFAGQVSSVAASGGTADFNVGFFAMGFLLVNNEVAAAGSQYTSKTYSVFTRGGGAFTLTEIATADGVGGGATFTVAWTGDSTIRVTNTQGNITSVRLAYFGL